MKTFIILYDRNGKLVGQVLVDPNTIPRFLRKGIKRKIIDDFHEIWTEIKPNHRKYLI